MKINRTKLLEELYEFSLGDHGMIVGKPGIGKSYMLRQLKKKLIENNVLSFIIKIDNAFDSSDEAIQAELKIDTNWLDTLAKIKLRNEYKAVLIFDAFDAARDETIRNGFLKQIKKAKKLLQDKWHIIVSVRTYDASKSVELTKLFPYNNQSQDASYCRKIEVDELTDDELSQVFTENQTLGEFFESSSNELKEILHIPFFLQLLELIIAGLNNDQIEEIKKIKSETQLLNTFWKQKVINTENHLGKEKLLLKLTNELVSHRTLSYAKSELLPTLSPEEITIFDYLRSENILDEVSINNSRIAFSHNILFDFAVSLYCLTNNGQKVLNFVAEDLTRPFFLRPSFVYFFTALWYQSPSDFWAIFTMLNHNPAKEIQLMVRLILNGVIANEFISVTELSPLLSVENNEHDVEIRNVLQSIRFIRKKTLPQDVWLLKELSGRLSVAYVFDFAYLLDRALTQITEGLLFDDCGRAARNTLGYVFEKRQSEYKEYLDRIAAQRAIELIAKTYKTDVNASRNLLSGVFKLIEEPGFDIGYFTSLAEYSKYILAVDPEFVANVYLTIFNYRENSQEKTRMGTGVVMSLISYRKQDFEMCYYRLQKLFPEFLSAAPNVAFSVGLEIVNNAVKMDRMMDRTEKVDYFQYEDLNALIIHDFSSLWGERLYGNKPVEITFDLINYLEELVEKSDFGQFSKFLRIYVANAQVGFLWKQLFKLAAKYPNELINEIFPLVMVPVLFTASETSFEVRDVIEKSAAFLTDDQIGAIETLIFEVYSIEAKSSVILTALSRIPSERLQKDFSKSFMADKTQIENEPGMRSSFSSTVYTNEEWLKDQGVDVSTPIFKELNQLINQLDAFSNVQLNNQPVYEEYNSALKVAKEAFYRILKDTTLPPELFFSVLNAVAKTVAIASRNLDGISEEDYGFFKSATLFAYNYISKFDDIKDQASPAHGYSPTPRIEAAEAIVNVYGYKKDQTVLTALEQAVNDTNTVVRFHAVRNLIKLFNIDYQLYRKLLTERLKTENDSFVYSTLLSNVMFKNVTLKEDASELLTLANSKSDFFTFNNTFLDNFSEMLLWALANEVEVAYDILFDAYQYPEFCHTIVFRMFEKMHPSLAENDYSKHNAEDAKKIAIIKHYIDQAGQVLTNVPEEKFNMQSPEVDAAFKIIDQIIIRIYFAIDAKTFHRSDFKLPVNEENRKHFYFLVKPVFEKIIQISEATTTKGLIIGHTAHYFIQMLNIVLHYDAKEILRMLSIITKCSIQGGYTLDSFAIQEVVRITEKLLADHRNLLLEDQPFKDLLDILDIYINSGWTNALELLWQLDEIFK